MIYVLTKEETIVNTILSHEITKRYITSSKEASNYYKLKLSPPHALMNQYYKDLEDYRDLLENLGVKQLKRKYYFNLHEKFTWKYLSDGLNQNFICMKP